MKKVNKFILSALLIFACMNSLIAQIASELDNSFGTNGIVVNDFEGSDEWVYSLAQQSDEKIIAVGIINSGDLFVTRYLSNGTIDISFGTSGYTTIETNISSSSNADVEIQSDGKIVIIGTYRNDTDNDFGIYRLTTDGILDATFGVGGIQTSNIGNSFDAARALAIQEDGKIVVAGQTSIGSPTSTNAVIVRYTSDGTLDNTFGTNGIVIHDISVGNEDFLIDVVINANGKIVATGTSTETNAADYSVSQYNSDGTSDVSFGSNGVVSIDYNNRPNNCKAIALQANGKILLTGDHSSATSYDYMTVRLNEDGTIDNSFGNSGIAISQFGSTSHNERGWDILEQPGGNILIAGEHRDWANIVRYASDGSLDATFGTDGHQVLDITPGDYDKARAILIQTDGKIVVGGNTFNTNNDLMLARFHGDENTSSLHQNSAIEDQLMVYPNPANSELTVSELPKNSLLSLTDINGKLVFQSSVSASQMKITTSNFESGVYILRVEGGNFIASKRFMIHH